MNLSRRLFLLGGTASCLALMACSQAVASEITVYKTPWCGCCNDWIQHLKEAGFVVSAIEREDIEPDKTRLGVPHGLRSCHTAIVDSYVVEGHVPAADIARLLKERPEAVGLAVPGMPVGSPGMEHGDRRDAYDVVLFSHSSQSVFARYEAIEG